MKRIISVLFVLQICSFMMSAQSVKNVLYYYATWMYGSFGSGGFKCPPESLDVGRITHVVHFDNGNVTQTPPYCAYMVDSTTNSVSGTDFETNREELLYAAISNPGSWPTNKVHWQERLLAKLHSEGIKVLLTIQAVNATNINYVSGDSARVEVFGDAWAMFAKRFGYDGLELDWEGWIAPIPSADRVNRLIRILRRNMDRVWGTNPKPLLMISCASSHINTYWASQDSLIDSYVMQMYDFDQNWGGSPQNCNAIWHMSPLNRGTELYPGIPIPPNSEVRGWNTSGPGPWIAAGHIPRTVGTLIPSYGVVYRGDTTLHACFPGGYAKDISRLNILNLLNLGGQYRRDADRGDVPYIAGRATANIPYPINVSSGQLFRATFEDSLSVAKKIHYLDSIGVETIGFYDIKGAIDFNATPSSRLPILNWIRASVTAAAPPALKVNPVYNSFGDVTINTTSGEISYTLSGSDLLPASGNISVSAPSGFQVSLSSGSGFGSSIDLVYGGSALLPTTINIRFQPTAVREYTDLIFHSGGGTTNNVSVTGNGVPVSTPVITISLSSLSFGAVTVGATSSNQTYALSAVGLLPTSGNINVNAPTGFRVSLSSGSGFGSSVSVAYSASTLSSTTIYVRFVPSAAQSYSGNITNAGGGATTRNVAVSGIGQDTTSPVLSINPVSISFGDVTVNTISSEETYSISGNNLTPASGNIAISSPTGYQVSTTSSSGFDTSIVVPYSSSALPSTTIYARFFPTIAQSYTGNIAHTGGGALAQSLEVSGNGISVDAVLLSQNYPNPFNPSTTIVYYIPRQTHVKIRIYNALGQVITTLVDEVKTSGTHQVICNTTDLMKYNLSSGVYFYQLEADGHTASKRLVLLK